jgi:hypothetical protein
MGVGMKATVVKFSLGVCLLTIPFSFSKEPYEGVATIEKITSKEVIMYIESDACHGLHRLKLREPFPEIKNIHMPVMFKASANPCKEEAYLIEILGPVPDIVEEKEE